MVSMLEVLVYLVVVGAAFAVCLSATDVALAVMYARSYYRRHPDRTPPDRLLVRLCLRGVR